MLIGSMVPLLPKLRLGWRAGSEEVVVNWEGKKCKKES
jgi:hypothetical protein